MVLLAVAASLFAFVSGARADGDPASDYLVSRQVFVSSQQGVESSAQRNVLATVGAANRAGFAIRVAIISSDYDLGSITALWRKPALYARFLGLELAPAYRGRLLVVMPNGFGLSWPGHPAGPEQQVLANVPTAAGEAGLLSAAQTAVRRLAAADGIAAVSARAAVGASRRRERQQQRVGYDGRGGRGRVGRTGRLPARPGASTAPSDERTGHARPRVDPALLAVCRWAWRCRDARLCARWRWVLRFSSCTARGIAPDRRLRNVRRSSRRRRSAGRRVAGQRRISGCAIRTATRSPSRPIAAGG